MEERHGERELFTYDSQEAKQKGVTGRDQVQNPSKAHPYFLHEAPPSIVLPPSNSLFIFLSLNGLKH
jgi:hypothetical protein